MSIKDIKLEYIKPDTVRQIFSDFIAEFLAMNGEEYNKWQEHNTQTSFESVLKSKKMKMQNPNKVEDEKQRP